MGFAEPEERPKKPVKKVWHIKVSNDGTGSDFPLDMLRYDECWPNTQNDARVIRENLTRNPGKWNVDLVSYKHPTQDRWVSFGITISAKQVSK